MKVLGFRLDAVYCRELDAVDAGVVRDVKVADHYPVWVDLLLPVHRRR